MGERVPVTVQRVLNRLGQLAECIEGGQDAHSLLPGIGLIEREVACLGDEARIQTLKKALKVCMGWIYATTDGVDANLPAEYQQGARALTGKEKTDAE